MLLMVAATMMLTAAPPEDVARDRCDIIELNHYYNGDGHPVFSQWIFWRWEGRAFRVLAWRMARKNRLPERQGDSWRLLWHDEGRLRQIEAAEFRQTWTQWDPELHDRRVWPTCLRGGLRK